MPKYLARSPINIFNATTFIGRTFLLLRDLLEGAQRNSSNMVCQALDALRPESLFGVQPDDHRPGVMVKQALTHNTRGTQTHLFVGGAVTEQGTHNRFQPLSAMTNRRFH
jgi:hypothetical protein